MEFKRKNLGLYLGCFTGVAVLLIILFKILGLAPFGGSTLASADAYYQYMDFYAWFHDVLHGSNNIGYTFGKTLGGTNIAVFSYYLASPLNLLVFFFDKTQLHTFFDLMILIKLALASMTCGIWLNRRFENQLGRVWIWFLSMGYGLCQYGLAQSSNVMWLDGVILLPLILLGIYRLIWKKNLWHLSLCVGISISLNWYTGGINCIFTGIWVFLEMFLFVEAQKQQGIRCGIKTWIKRAVDYILSMLVGVLLSACLFLPTVMALRGGRATMNKELFYNQLIANPASFLPGFSIGAINSWGNLSLFCGSLTVIGCIGLFFSKVIRKWQKVILGVFLAICLLIFYWQPAIWLFSMFKDVGSYWYRYSYVGIIGMIFCAAFYFSNKKKEEAVNWWIIIGTVLFAGLMLVVNHFKPIQENTYLIVTIVILLVMAFFISGINGKGKKAGKKVLCILLGVAVIGELVADSTILLKQYKLDNVEEFKSYEKNQQAQIDEILTADNSYYRMTQLRNRLFTPDGLSCTYNEALAFGYWSIAGYTSDPDDDQREMLERFGYRMNGENYNIVTTSVLTADSLLGVKYVLSDRIIKGLKEQKQFSVLNEKSVYLNPYCLPMAFRYEQSMDDIKYNGNPFEYQNELYSALLGRNVKLYTPVDYQKNEEGDAIRYQLDVPQGNVLLYGNLPWNRDYVGMLNVNNVYPLGYAKWGSPSVFDVPIDEEAHTAEVVQTGEYGVDVSEVQFYALNLDLFKEVTEELSAKAAKINEMKNGYVSIQTDAKQGEKLFLSIPTNDGWKITLNGKEVIPELISDCLMSISLKNGDNSIELTYRVPGLRTGAIVSLAGVLLLLVCICGTRKRQRK